ncbi:MAG: U32 family peptidase, partial [Clostridia bacterium]|nr:U32 family peptidase [Clostridia bacterium]
MNQKNLNQNKPELLSPAGNYESLVAAINAGADAIYLAGSQFGARAYAHNFDQNELIEAIELAHLYHKKIYLTVNTLLKNEELDQLYAYILPYYQAGLDAVIVQDLGVISQIKHFFPDLSIHASTQMTITAAEGVRLLDDYQVKRVVLARELSIDEISEIKKHSKAELEVFIHGALCYCYSGKCLLSSMIGGRSGNRGRCAQPCRLPYDLYKDQTKQNLKNEQYLLSTKDICTLSHIPEMIQAGIDSFKIEGRMKRPEYVAGVTHYYRKAIDDYFTALKHHADFQVKETDLKDLISIYCRGKSSESYLHQQNHKDMITKIPPSYETGSDRLFESISDTYLVNPKKISVDATAVLQTGKKSLLTLFCQDQTVTVEGDIVAQAQKMPVTGEMIEKQIKKTGNTSFV